MITQPKRTARAAKPLSDPEVQRIEEALDDCSEEKKGEVLQFLGHGKREASEILEQGGHVEIDLDKLSLRKQRKLLETLSRAVPSSPIPPADALMGRVMGRVVEHRAAASTNREQPKLPYPQPTPSYAVHPVIMTRAASRMGP